MPVGIPDGDSSSEPRSNRKAATSSRITAPTPGTRRDLTRIGVTEAADSPRASYGMRVTLEVTISLIWSMISRASFHSRCHTLRP